MQKWVIKIKCCCCGRKIKVNTIFPQQQWWGHGLMLLKAHSDMRKLEQRTWIVAKKPGELASIRLSNFLAISQILCSVSSCHEWAFNNIKLLPLQNRIDLYLPTQETTFYFYHSFPQRWWARNCLFYSMNHFCHKCGIKDLT